MEQRRNERAERTRDPRENPLTSSIVGHDFHSRISGTPKNLNDIGLHNGKKTDYFTKCLLLEKPWHPPDDYRYPFSTHSKGEEKTVRCYLSKSHIDKYHWLVNSDVSKGKDFLRTYHAPEKEILNHISSQRLLLVEENRDRLCSIIETVIFIGRQNMPFRYRRDDGKLCSESVAVSNEDEDSQDVVRKEVRLTGKALGRLVLDYTTYLGLDLRYCVGVGTDGYAVITSEKCGASKVRSVRNATAIMKEIIAFFSQSAKRNSILNADVDSQLARLCETRWGESHDADTLGTLHTLRQDSEQSFSVLHKDAECTATQLGVHLIMPCLAARQMHRANYDANSIEEYYRKSIYIPLLDVLIDLSNDSHRMRYNVTTCAFFPPSFHIEGR
ncbi:hypothetical protein PR048_021242 [Dryococelus australis]|uniref:Uncharacterized protein n=1 Tax=Dryococelus australis TaxID=614101 RepID=A0ABQ9GXM7_9NEOP|nr:hypothetical protein PR048_021242 [Dryococelus australis]